MMANGGGRYLLLSAGDRLAAISIGHVHRILRALPTVPLPGAQPQLLGLAEYGGEPLPVVDLAVVLGTKASPSPRFPVTVVVWVGPSSQRELVGLAADAALDLVSFPPDRLVPTGERGIAGAVTLPQGTVEVLDLSRLGQS